LSLCLVVHADAQSPHWKQHGDWPTQHRHSQESILIGSDVLIGSYVQIIDFSHGIERSCPTGEQRALIGEVQIDDDVWIGAGAKILMGAKIRGEAVIGANAVVRSEIPEYAIALGSPARVVKFPE
jgi:acetyltransferase-like isoleucine patch superfamily enzyme